MHFVPPACLSLLLVLGDSVSAGAGASQPGRAYAALLRHNDDAAWPSERGQDLTRLAGPDLAALNLARGGATTSDTLRALVQWRASVRLPAAEGRAAVAITSGGNDLKNALLAGLSAGPERARMAAAGALQAALRNLEAVVAKLRDPALFPGGCDVYLANVYDPSDGRELVATPDGEMRLTGFDVVVRRWREAYAALAKRLDVKLVDAHALFYGHGFVPPSLGRTEGKTNVRGLVTWFADPLHPNDLGHHQLRRAFYRAIAADAAERCASAKAPPRAARR